VKATNTHSANRALTATSLTDTRLFCLFKEPVTVDECSTSRANMECADIDTMGTANTASVGANAREQQVSRKNIVVPVFNRQPLWLMAASAFSKLCFSDVDASFDAFCGSGRMVTATGRSNSRTWKSIHMAAQVGGRRCACEPTRGSRLSRPTTTSLSSAHTELKPSALAPYSLRH
jgi:hypothetical protein